MQANKPENTPTLTPEVPVAEPVPKPPKSNKFTLLVSALVVCILISLSSLGLAITVMITNRPAATTQTQPDGNFTQLDTSSIDSVVAKVSPSVVSIISTVKTTSIFGSYNGQASGTGIIVSADGYILTNKHVVEGARELTVVTDSGDTYEDIDIVGEDPLNDIAYIKINGVSDLTPAEIGDSKTVSIGQAVIAIGNALGQYQNTVTSGIISGRARNIEAEDGSGTVESLSDLFQTDAAINPGNSGGPLVNAAGQVIGINTAVATDSQGIGFAIPIGAAKGTLKNLLTTGNFSRAFMGLAYYSVTPDIAKEYDLPVKSGAYVYTENGSAVQSGTPAAKAGLKDGDIILKVNGIDIGEKGSLSLLTAEYSSGETIQLTVLRGEDELTIDITLTSYKN